MVYLSISTFIRKNNPTCTIKKKYFAFFKFYKYGNLNVFQCMFELKCG